MALKSCKNSLELLVDVADPHVHVDVDFVDPLAKLALDLVALNADSSIKVRLEVPILDRILLGVLLDSALQLVTLLIKADLEQFALALNNPRKPAHCTLPVFTFVIILPLGLGDKQIGALLLNSISLGHDAAEIAEYTELHLGGVDGRILDHLGIAVAHNGD